MKSNIPTRNGNALPAIRKAALLLCILFSGWLAHAQTYKMKIETNVWGDNYNGSCANDYTMIAYFTDNTSMVLASKAICPGAYTHINNIPASKTIRNIHIQSSRNWKRFIGGCSGYDGGSRDITNLPTSGCYVMSYTPYDDKIEHWSSTVKITTQPNISIQASGTMLTTAFNVVVQAPEGFPTDLYKWEYQIGSGEWKSFPSSFQGSSTLSFNGSSLPRVNFASLVKTGENVKVRINYGCGESNTVSFEAQELQYTEGQHKFIVVTNIKEKDIAICARCSDQYAISVTFTDSTSIFLARRNLCLGLFTHINDIPTSKVIKSVTITGCINGIGIIGWPDQGDFVRTFARTDGVVHEDNRNVIFTFTMFTPLAPLPPPAQPSNENYILSTTYHSADKAQFGQQITYYDGLGRPMQEVAVGQSPAKKDIVRPIAYDALGREEKVYLPYEHTGTSGSYTSTAIADQKTFYTSYANATDAANAFAQSAFDNSPLNRLTAQAAPGNSWRLGGGRDTKTAYLANTASEVRLWAVSTNGMPIHGSQYYAANQLYVTETTDEDGIKSRQYTDKLGRVVETRLGDLRTSYVYDDLDRLRCVVPPKAQNMDVAGAEFKSLLYLYTYDGRGRAITRQLPGADLEYMVYDLRDRLAMSQDGNLRAASKWKVHKYDALNRPVAVGLVSGIKSGTTAYTHAELMTAYAAPAGVVNETASGAAYSLTAVSGTPTLTANGVLSYTFYDNYAWCPTTLAYAAGDFPFSYTGYLPTPKGQPTGTRVKVLDGNEETATASWLQSASYYDDHYRVVQQVEELYGGGSLRASNRYAFDGVLERNREVRVFNAITNTVEQRFEYDHARRPTKTYHKVNAQAEVLLAENTYDALGKLKAKAQGGGVEAINYTYNIRGWLTAAKASRFSTELHYNSLPAGLTGTARWNGNIAAQTWQHAGGTAQSYAYTYDAYNRLAQGLHSGGGNYNEKSIAYDANGNITALTRENGSNPGTYAYTYSGNRLASLKVGTATATPYTYDANGNATKDGYRGMDIAYNVLNLPKKVSKGSPTPSTLEYIYDAAGTKLAKKVNGTFTQYYAGNAVYLGTKTLDYLLTPEGMARNVNNTYVYQYNLTDHLGNVRAVYDASAKTIVQKTDYYPFGLAQILNSPNKNKYLYNGKELQDEKLDGTSFGMLDYGARFYDPVVGRWHSIDPLAEKGRRWSPYNYCYDNPMRFKDPDGREGIKYTDENGTKTIESNVVVLLEQKRVHPEGASEKTIARINRQNARIENRNAARLTDVQTRLNETYNGRDGEGAKNSAGENVKFRFNVIGIEATDTQGGTLQQIRDIAKANGLSSSKKDFNGDPVKAFAAVVTTRSTGGALGLSNRIFVTEASGAPPITLPHEVGHTLHLNDTYPKETRGLMDYPPGGLISSEVDVIWNNAYEK